jgi:AcrR family transcriptional regulator
MPVKFLLQGQRSVAAAANDVEKLAPVSKSNIFHYFNSKHALCVAVLDQERQMFCSPVEQ